MPVGKHNGVIVRAPGGKIGKGAATTTTTTGCGTNTCGSTSCTSKGVSVQCPQMCVTLFDADYAGGNITWCGRTWTPSEIQAGTTKKACPTYYSVLDQTSGTAGNKTFHYEKWRHDPGPATPDDLELVRSYYTYFVTFVSFTTTYQRRTINLLGQAADRWFNALAGPSQSTCDMNVLCGNQGTTVNDYRIIRTGGNGDMFGSHTIGGVQYSWDWGEGW